MRPKFEPLILSVSPENLRPSAAVLLVLGTGVRSVAMEGENVSVEKNMR